MKITKNNQLGLVLTKNKEFVQKLFTVHMDNYLSDNNIELENLTKEQIETHRNELIDFFLNPTRKEVELLKNQKTEFKSIENGLAFPVNKNYVFSNKSLEIVKNIRVDLDKFDPVIISSLTEGKMGTFLCGKNLAFRYWFKNNNLLVMILELNEQGMFRYVNCRLRASDNSYSFPDNPEIAHWENTYFIQFLQMLFFVEFGEVEYRTLVPNQKYGTKREGNYLNDTDNNIVLVDSNWNIVTVSGDGFKVSGHLRMQPVGEGRKQRKLIFISQFEKEGYTRRGGGTIIN